MKQMAAKKISHLARSNDELRLASHGGPVGASSVDEKGTAMTSSLDRAIARYAAGLARAGAVACFLAAPVLAEESYLADGDAGLELRVAAGLVSISAQDVPLQDVLDEIASQSGLVLVQESPLPGRLTVAIERLSLRLALQRILRDSSYQLYEATLRPTADEASNDRPSTLWIFTKGTSTRSDAVEFLETAILEDDLRARKEAVKVLANIGSADVIGPLSLALADDDSSMRIAAIDALAAIGGEEALAALASAAMDDDAWVRGEAAYALAETGERSAAQYLALAMNDESPAVRASVAGAYAELPRENAIPALAIALRDPDPSVRLEAVEALEEIGGTAALQTLRRVEHDRDSEVQDAIDESLTLLQGQSE